jgi:transketolase
MSNITQRDAFWNRVYELASADRNIIVVSEDMGAPSLDKFRTDLNDQFVNVGIAEQNGLLVAAGMAMEGKRCFVYAIAPFVTLRALEFIRVENAIMNIPLTIVGVGGGFGYDDSGPTHHLIEDIAIMRSMPNITINSISDAVMAAAVADESIAMSNTNYIRLDRQVSPALYKKGDDFSHGFSVIKPNAQKYIIATGRMVQTALNAAEKLATEGIELGVIDVFRIPLCILELVKAIGGRQQLFSLEEHFLPGGMGSYLLEILNDEKICIPLTRLGLSFEKGYCYTYGGREKIHEYYGVDVNSVVADIKKSLA